MVLREFGGPRLASFGGAVLQVPVACHILRMYSTNSHVSFVLLRSLTVHTARTALELTHTGNSKYVGIQYW